MGDEWLTFPEAAKIVRGWLDASIGRSLAVLTAARSSGEVRSQGRLSAFDGIVDPGKTVDDYLPRLCRSDLTDWLDRNHPRAPAVPSKRKCGRPRKFDLIAVAAEVQQLMNHHGEFSADDPEWNAQACLVEALRDKFGGPSNSTLEKYVKQPLANWRAQKHSPRKT
jgi:hypothetical protein